MPIVVEGWIDEGAAPVVIVTHAVDLTADSVSFDDIVEKWGRVSVFDGDERYILTGHLNSDYTPSFVFTTSRLKGRQGHSYRLLIETEHRQVEAVSSITPCPAITEVVPVSVEGTDSLFKLRAFFDGIDPDGYYKVFTKSDAHDTRYHGALLATFRGSDYDSQQGFEISRGKYSGYSGEPFEYFFRRGDFVSVKLVSMEADIFDFWLVYDRQIFLSDNLFFSFTEDCPSNITDGRGYWAAYGASIFGLRL